MKNAGTALGLLVLLVIHNNAHKWVPPDLRGHVFNVTGHGLLAVCLAALLVIFWRSGALVLVCALGIGYALQVAGCSAWWLVAPWPTTPTGELCSERLGLPLGLFGLAAALLLAAHLRRNT